jgi:hypothetical protein
VYVACIYNNSMTSLCVSVSVCVSVFVLVAFLGALNLFCVDLRYRENKLRVFKKIVEFLSGRLLYFIEQPLSFSIFFKPKYR